MANSPSSRPPNALQPVDIFMDPATSSRLPQAQLLPLVSPSPSPGDGVAELAATDDSPSSRPQDTLLPVELIL